MFLRNSAKAIIVHEGRLLAIRSRDAAGGYYILPGGGQRAGETLVETLKREVREETGAEVEAGELRFIREYVARNHEFAEQEPDVHSLEFLFECRLVRAPDEERQTHPDENQLGWEWLDLERLEERPFWPKVLRRLLAKPSADTPVYLGDVN
ncbi:MAG: hypothetical protein AMK73_09135 [Planctomycetes bacterium SM23_32]|nr:MAG: hypothetical protein AMK73_09135 [Planctomycetes bacterium SM23_32]